MAAGTFSRAKPFRRRPSALTLAWIATLGLFVLTLIVVAILGDPQAGLPLVRLAVVRGVQSLPPQKSAALSSQPPSSSGPGTALPPALVPGTITRQVYAGRSLVADPDLVEATPSGPLPRIASNGRTPMSMYAGATTAPTGLVRVALVISGLGISANQTAAALATLPPQVTLAFAPYADDVQRWVGEARKDGHEVLVQVPMEPYEVPESDPGPHTLRAGQDENLNTQRLVWAMTRFTGYAGVTNMQGGRFLADAKSLAPMLTYVARRGLLFFDDGEVPRSAAPEVAGQVGIAFARSVTRIDSIQTASEVDRNLAALETAARAGGSAAGAGFVYPVTVQRVAAWAAGLNARGFALVPASAIAWKPRTQ